MLENIEINCHSSIKIRKGKIIYIDPFKIEKESHDADIILITHDHYDHYSPEDIEKIDKQDTIIVAPKTVKALEQEPICPSLGIDCEDCPAYECTNWVFSNTKRG